MKKVVVAGTSGAGKSSLAYAIAAKLHCPYIELDSLGWGPGWQKTPDEILYDTVSKSIKRDSWVVDGNYSVARPLTWSSADTLVWLDYPFIVVFWRLIKRSVRRCINKEPICNGNYERVKTHLFSRNSLILWVLKTHWKRRKTIPENLQDPNYQHLKLIHLRSPMQTNRWFNTF